MLEQLLISLAKILHSRGPLGLLKTIITSELTFQSTTGSMVSDFLTFHCFAFAFGKIRNSSLFIWMCYERSDLAQHYKVGLK